MNCPTRDPEPSGNPTFNQSPPAFEKTLIPRSSPVCGGGISSDDYNMGLHVMALFVVLGQSSLACAFPLIAKRFPSLRIPPSFLFFARHFGTGVLLATAFVHLLPTAFASLLDPCLPPIWNTDYPAMPGAIAMCAVFLVTIVEMVFTRGLCKGGTIEVDEKNHQEATLERGNGKGGRTGSDDEAIDDSESEHIGGLGGLGKLGFGMAGRRRSRSHSLSQGLHRLSDISRLRDRPNSMAPMDRGESVPASPAKWEGHLDVNSAPMTPMTPPTQFSDGGEGGYGGHSQAHGDHSHSPSGKIVLTPQQKHKKAMLQVFLLEMGILFHSVFIGMALSVTVGPPFIVLLIAVVFHQTFEGLALGSRIAVLQWSDSAVQPWLMALAYGLTTPIGQAIGLGTHSLYAPDSATGLLMVGIMNAISSGLLLFAGLVELLAEDFLSDDSWQTLRGRRRVAACVFVFLGAFGMAVVGAWA